MRKSLQIRPLNPGKLRSPTPEQSPTPLQRTSPSPTQTRASASPAPTVPTKPRSVLELILASRRTPQSRRVESESAGLAEEISYVDAVSRSANQRASLPGSSLALPVGRKSTAGSASQARSVTHTRMSSIESIEPLTSDMMGKAQEWMEGTSNSEVTSERLKLPSEKRKQAERFTPDVTRADPSDFVKERQDMFSIGKVADSTRARKELMALIRPDLPSQNAVISLAIATPDRYPALDLSEKGLMDSDVSNIVKLLQVYPFATVLDLYGNQLTFRTCEGVAFACYFPAILRLSLSRNPLSPLTPTTIIGQFIRSFPNAQTLELADCGLTDEDLFRVAVDFTSLQYLRVLSLHGNHISNEGAQSLVPVVEKCAALELLDLRNTQTTRKVLRFFRRHKAKLLITETRKCCEQCRLL